MKQGWKILIAAALLATAAVAATGCSPADAYREVGELGYDVRVRFDANGGLFAGRQDVSLVDVFNADDYKNADGTVSIPLLPPEDELRGNATPYEVTRDGYILVGWYRTRTPRVDSAGQALDDYGAPVAQSGRPQGYTYGGRWDFATDRVDATAAVAGTDVLTLYAAWVPRISYEFYYVEAGKDPVLYKSEAVAGLSRLPVWNTENGRLDMGDIPAREGYTFDGAYLDAALSTPIEGGLENPVDLATGTATASTVRVYTTWRAGNWFRIHTAAQLYSNARLDGHYELMADLDVSEAVGWPAVFATGEFTGTIEGNGHTIRNIRHTIGGQGVQYGGLFGKLSSAARIANVDFENVTVTLEPADSNATLGLLCGEAAEGVTVENVTVAGGWLLGDSCAFHKPTLGLLVGTGAAYIPGVSHDAITCERQNEGNVRVRFDVDEVTGVVTFQ